MAGRLTGRLVIEIRRRAKYILLYLEGGGVVIAHLGMSGRMVIAEAPAPAPGKHDHVVLETDDGAVVSFNDARRFGLMVMTSVAELPAHPLLAGLGPEPLEPGFTPAVLSLATPEAEVAHRASLHGAAAPAQARGPARPRAREAGGGGGLEGGEGGGRGREGEGNRHSIANISHLHPTPPLLRPI